MLIPLSRGSEGLRYPVARAIGFTGFVTALAAVALALVPPLFSGWLMMRARHAVHQGDPSAGLRWLEWSARILPSIRHDSGFVEQQGLLERALGRDTLESRLYAAILLERQGFAFQARAQFEQLMDTAPPGGGVRREAVRALLRAGINELNSGAPGDALLTLERVLQAEPCNLKALYTIQLAGLRTARFDVVRPHAERMLAIYERFNTLTKAPEIAACHENLSYADFQSGDLNSALAQHTRAIGRK
jgi:tetratricopeptide (TPR) repeat protein